MKRLLFLALLLTGCTGSAIVGDEPTPAADDDDAVGDDDDAVDGPDFSVPGPTGSGNTTLAETNRGGKNLFIDVWYPSDASGDTAVYGEGEFANRGVSVVDGEGACDEPRPVMVHSHGHLSIRWELYWLHEHMASHGWVIAAPDHAGNTFYDDSANFIDLYSQRPYDVADTFDALLAESSRPESPLHGCVDPAAGYVVGGYSFGGYTAYATAGGLVNDTAGEPTYDLSDSRVTSVVAYFPWTGDALDDGTAEIEVPVLTWGATRDSTVGTDYDILHGPIESTPRALGVFPDGGHHTFTQLYCPFIEENGCGDEFVSEDVAYPAARTGVLGFLTGNLDLLVDVEDALEWEIVAE